MNKTRRSLNHTEAWLLISRHQYNDEFIRELYSCITNLTSQKSVLECGCGDAHVLKGLVELGLAPCLGIDIDKTMVDHAKIYKKNGLKVRLDDWRNLKEVNTYGTVLCRGGSLMYYDTWNQGVGKNTKPILIREEQIRNCVKVMWDAVAPKGLLYVDVIPEQEIITGLQHIERKTVDMNVSGRVFSDKKNKLRTIEVKGNILGKEIKFEATSHLYTRSDLMRDLIEFGVEKESITFPKLKHETMFDVVCVVKSSNG